LSFSETKTIRRRQGDRVDTEFHPIEIGAIIGETLVINPHRLIKDVAVRVSNAEATIHSPVLKRNRHDGNAVSIIEIITVDDNEVVSTTAEMPPSAVVQTTTTAVVTRTIMTRSMSSSQS